MQMRFNFCNDAEVVRVRNVVQSSIYNIANVVYDVVRQMDRLFRRAKKKEKVSFTLHFNFRRVTRQECEYAFLFDLFWRATRYLCANFTLLLCSTSSQLQLRRGRKSQTTKSRGVCLNPCFTLSLTRRFTIVGRNNREMQRHTPGRYPGIN